MVIWNEMRWEEAKWCDERNCCWWNNHIADLEMITGALTEQHTHRHHPHHHHHHQQHHHHFFTVAWSLKVVRNGTRLSLIVFSCARVFPRGIKSDVWHYAHLRYLISPSVKSFYHHRSLVSRFRTSIIVVNIFDAGRRHSARCIGDLWTEESWSMMNYIFVDIQSICKEVWLEGRPRFVSRQSSIVNLTISYTASCCSSTSNTVKPIGVPDF